MTSHALAPYQALTLRAAWWLPVTSNVWMRCWTRYVVLKEDGCLWRGMSVTHDLKRGYMLSKDGCVWVWEL